MSLPISERAAALLLALAGLAACAGESGLPEGEAVPCALAGAADFAAQCIFERLDESGARFAIHHPDGAFRRFTFDAGTGAFALADGAESLAVSEETAPGEALLAVGRDRYRVQRAWLGRPAE